MSASVQDFYSRRLLLHPLPLHRSEPSSIASSPSFEAPQGENSFDAYIIMVLSVLFCALVCSVGSHFLIRCLMRCTSIAVSRYNVPASTMPGNTGINKKALKAFPTIVYSAESKLPGLDTECAICLSDFASGERLRLLPKCNHGFHAKCIDKWLSSHSTCPKCRRCLIETCEKIVGCSQSPVSPMPPVQVQDFVVVSIVPLQPEGFARNYREN